MILEMQTILEMGMDIILKFLGFLIFLIVGFWVIKRLNRLVIRLLQKTNLEATFINFIGNSSYYFLVTLLLLMALSQLGIETASLIAILGTAGLAIGLALQGSLSNIASGVLLVLFRYFKVGDWIEVGGVDGKVESIEIFSTTICTFDNCLITIPNKKVIEGNIINYVAKPIRRIDLVIGVSYTDNIDQVKMILSRILAQDKRILSEPEPLIAVGDLADSSVNFWVRPWVETANYLPTKLALLEAIKKRLDAEGITIPFPQQDIHLFQEPS